jgi:hypothetical protein
MDSIKIKNINRSKTQPIFIKKKYWKTAKPNK